MYRFPYFICEDEEALGGKESPQCHKARPQDTEPELEPSFSISRPAVMTSMTMYFSAVHLKYRIYIDMSVYIPTCCSLKYIHTNKIRHGGYS